ncbi:MAG: R3H domain-containing nucleic acid-binding protein [Myxococcota bacterium]
MPVPTDGPTEVIMRVAEGVQLSEVGEDAHEVLRDVLTGMGFGMTVDVTEDEASIRFDMNSGVYHDCLVAKEMELLDALQHLVDKVVNFDAEDRKKVVIDSGGAKRQVDEDLGRSAVELADRAVEEGKTFKMGPLDPRSRRLIHMALREHAGVTTRSEGEGVFRRVCIVPNDAE